MIRILDNQFQELAADHTCTCTCTCPEPGWYFAGYADGYIFSDAYYKPTANQR